MTIDMKGFVANIQEKWNGRPCPMCGAANWKVQPSIFQMSEYSDQGLMVGGVPLLPLVPVTCSNCGNTMLVNAVVSGLVSIDGTILPAGEETKDGK